MAALPYMPLYVADYMSDAAHLTTLEHGAYLLLIMTYWQRGEALPNDDKKLARICRMGPRQWQGVRDNLSEFFQVDCNTWSHSRIDRELQNVHDKSLKKRKAGLARAKQMHSTCSAPAKLTDTDTDTDTEVKDKPSPPRKRASRIPDGWKPSIPYPPKVGELVSQWPQGREARELDGFRDYWKARNRDAARVDWDLVWHNRIRDQHDRIMKGSDNGKPTTRQIGERLAASYEGGNDCLPNGLPLIGAARGS